MSNPVDSKCVDEINLEFESLQAKGDRIVPDGILDLKKYNSAKKRIMWILKQEVDYGENDYFQHLRNGISFIRTSPTWRRISYVSACILNDIQFKDISQLSNDDLFDVMLHTAIVNLDKEPGDTNSPNELILEKYKKYCSIVSLQISVYAPDIIIIGLPEGLNQIVDDVYCLFTGKKFHFSIPNIRNNGADVAVAGDNNKLFLWTYHPCATRGANGQGITDKDYVETLINGASYLNNLPWMKRPGNG